MRDGSITITRLITAYMTEYVGRDTTRAQRLGWWHEHFGHLRLDQFDDDVLHDALEGLRGTRGAYWAGRDQHGRAILRAKRRKLSAATVNRYLSAISSVLTWAQRRRITPKGWSHPARTVELLPENNKRVRYLADDQRAKLLEACRASKWERLYLFVLLLLTSGCRRGEAEGLKWGDLDLERGEALVQLTKNGRPRVLVLVPAVVEELRKFKAAPGSLVFASKRKPGQPFNVVPVWTHALTAAGIKDFHIHDCRHDAASSMAKAGFSLLAIGTALGHSQMQTTMRYAHLATADTKAMVHKVMEAVK